MVSYDVTALFTSVPVAESLAIIKSRLEQDMELEKRTPFSPQQITNLLECCLCTTYFTFEGTFYQQTEGAAMGSPVSPIVANLFMEDFEIKALNSFHNKPRFWGRYVDDTITIINNAERDNFTAHINNQHPAIKFTLEMEKDNQIAMLDTLITKNQQGALNFQVYRKPTHTDQYQDQFTSQQPFEHKLSVIRTLTHRAKRLCSTDEATSNELHHIKKVLTICGYQKWAWDLPSSRKKLPHPNTNRETSTKGHVTIPYIEGITEAISRKCRKAGITVHATPHNTIRSKLVHPKDKTATLDKSGAVYKITCPSCPASYIGETKRAVRIRIKEHSKSISPVGQHMLEHQHQFANDDISVLDRDQRWTQRGIKEAIYIAAHNPTLNRDRGRHQLPAVYDSLIRSGDIGITPMVHD